MGSRKPPNYITTCYSESKQHTVIYSALTTVRYRRSHSFEHPTRRADLANSHSKTSRPAIKLQKQGCLIEDL